MTQERPLRGEYFGTAPRPQPRGGAEGRSRTRDPTAATSSAQVGLGRRLAERSSSGLFREALGPVTNPPWTESRDADGKRGKDEGLAAPDRGQGGRPQQPRGPRSKLNPQTGLGTQDPLR